MLIRQIVINLNTTCVSLARGASQPRIHGSARPLIGQSESLRHDGMDR